MRVLRLCPAFCTVCDLAHARPILLSIPLVGEHTGTIRTACVRERDINAIYVRRRTKRDKSSVKRDNGTNTPKAVLSRLNRDG